MTTNFYNLWCKIDGIKMIIATGPHIALHYHIIKMVKHGHGNYSNYYLTIATTN